MSMAAEFSTFVLSTESTGLPWQRCCLYRSRHQVSWVKYPTTTTLQSRKSCFAWNGRAATECDNSLAVRLMGAAGYPNRRCFSRFCVGSLQNAQITAPLSWVWAVDQLLLIITIAFTHMAGVVPLNGSYANQRMEAVEGTITGRYDADKTNTKFRDSWIQVEQKILDALDSVNRDGFAENVIEWDKFNAKCPHSLLAIKGDSGLRLLHAAFQRLREEVSNIAELHDGASHGNWLVVSSTIIQGSVQPIFFHWLEGELSLPKNGHEKEPFHGVLRKLKADDSISWIVNFSEKADLYADLLSYLRFGSRSDYYYDGSVPMQHEVDILEDLVVTLADGISSIYLEIISLDSTLSPDVNSLGLSLCSLSTRALQKLRNQVALNRWIIQNFESIVLMYEDRFDLFILKRKQLVKCDKDASNSFDLWRGSLFRKQTAASSLNYIIISPFPIFVKRTKDLKALAGWKYYYSLFLELSDIAMPLIKAAFVKARNAVSFFLTCLIGRSLGLIYTGIRQSLGWR